MTYLAIRPLALLENIAIVLKTPMITANFKQFKNGEYKTIAIFSKRARGLMARYVIDNKIESVNDLKHFSSDNYRF